MASLDSVAHNCPKDLLSNLVVESCQPSAGCRVGELGFQGQAASVAFDDCLRHQWDSCYDAGWPVQGKVGAAPNASRGQGYSP